MVGWLDFIHAQNISVYKGLVIISNWLKKRKIDFGETDFVTKIGQPIRKNTKDGALYCFSLKNFNLILIIKNAGRRRK